MPTTQQRQVTVEYDEWTKGPQFAFNRRAGVGNKGYICEQMHLYMDGSLGVIPGLKEWDDYTGWTSTWRNQVTAQIIWQPYTADYQGELWILGASDGSNDKILRHRFSTATWAASTTLEASAPSWSAWADQSVLAWNADFSISGSTGASAAGGVQHTLSYDDRVFGAETRVNSAGSVSTFSWTETDPMINWTEYRGRVYAWRGAGSDHPTRVWYSDIDDYQTQTSADQYFDVGISNNIVYIKGAWSLRDSILFCLSNNDWYAYSGVPGSAQLRFVGRYVGPAHQAAGVVLGNELYFLSPIDYSPCVATPQGVDSTTFADKQMRDLAYSALDRIFPTRAVASVEQSSVLLTSGILSAFEEAFYALELNRGVWFPNAYLIGSSTLTTIGHLQDVATIANGRAYAFVTNRQAGEDDTKRVRLFTRDVRLDRPANANDQFSQPRSQKAKIVLAPFTPEPGNEARVRTVIVEGRYWKSSGLYTTPQILVPGFNADVALSARPDASAGEDFRMVFRSRQGTTGAVLLSDARSAFQPSPQVQLDNMESVAIDRVIVEYEVRPMSQWHGQTSGT